MTLSTVHLIGYMLGIVVVILAPFAFYYLMKYFSKVLCTKFPKREITEEEREDRKEMWEAIKTGWLFFGLWWILETFF